MPHKYAIPNDPILTINAVLLPEQQKNTRSKSIRKVATQIQHLNVNPSNNHVVAKIGPVARPDLLSQESH